MLHQQTHRKTLTGLPLSKSSLQFCHSHITLKVAAMFRGPLPGQANTLFSSLERPDRIWRPKNGKRRVRGEESKRQTCALKPANWLGTNRALGPLLPYALMSWTGTASHILTPFYTGCNRRKGPDFGRVFLMLNYTDITQNTYIQS